MTTMRTTTAAPHPLPVPDAGLTGAPFPRDLHGILTDRAHDAAADVVVCVHDALDDVRRCLWSVLARTRLTLHLVIVDDGSAEPTASFLADLAAREPAVSLIRRGRGEPAGYPRAANAGLDRCGAPWTVLLNSDCIVPVGWLRGLIAAAERSGASIIGPVSNAATYQSVPVTLDGTRWRANDVLHGLTYRGWLR